MKQHRWMIIRSMVADITKQEKGAKNALFRLYDDGRISGLELDVMMHRMGLIYN